MSPSATLVVIGLNLFGIAFHAILYAFVVGKKVEKINQTAAATASLTTKSESHESRISFIEGMMKVRRA